MKGLTFCILTLGSLRWIPAQIEIRAPMDSAEAPEENCEAGRALSDAGAFINGLSDAGNLRQRAIDSQRSEDSNQQAAFAAPDAVPRVLPYFMSPTNDAPRAPRMSGFQDNPSIPPIVVAAPPGMTAPLYVCPACRGDSSLSIDSNTITVTAEGRVRVPAEYVELRIAASQDAPTAMKAKQLMDQKLRKVMDLLAGGNVTGEWGQGYRVFPKRFTINKQHHWKDNKMVFSHFTAAQDIGIELHNLTALDKLLIAVLDGGSDLAEIGGVTLKVVNPSQYEALARERAAREAKETATEILRHLGHSLGGLQSVQVGPPNPGPPIMARAVGVSERAKIASDSGGASSEIYEDQTVDFTSHITAMFRIVPSKVLSPFSEPLVAVSG